LLTNKLTAYRRP